MSVAPRFLFVTGTDTGVGKTMVSCALLSAWRRRGLPIAALKPIETGTSPGIGDPDADSARLAEAAGQHPEDTVCLRFPLPLAPQAAARAAGVPIEPARLVAACRARPAARILVEGAGGLLVPIAPGYTMADLAAELDAAVLVVARSRLGTINHSLLTLAECHRRGLRVLGIVLNRCQPEPDPFEAQQDNAALIAGHAPSRPLPIFGPFPYLQNSDCEALAAAAERHLPALLSVFDESFPQSA